MLQYMVKASRQNLIQVFFFLFLVLCVCQGALAGIRATGNGENMEQALNSALQSAVEQGAGVALSSSTVVKDFKLVKDEIVTHAKGYVRSYDIVEQKEGADGELEIVIDAVVDDKLMLEHAQAMEILMRMLGRPTFMVAGEEKGLHAVSAYTEKFDALLQEVEQVLSDTFHFRILDWNTLRENHDLRGVLTPEKALKLRKKTDADYLISISLDLPPEKKPELYLKAVRLSDEVKLAETVTPLDVHVPDSESLPQTEDQVVTQARKKVHFASLDLAKAVVKTLRRETERGHGLRYKLTFLDFPRPEEFVPALQKVKGYVRHKVDRMGSRNVRIIYWSNLKSATLMEKLRNMLGNMGYDFNLSMDGRDVSVTWKDPDGF